MTPEKNTNEINVHELINYDLIYERVRKMKMDELFSEPYDGDLDDVE